MLVIFLDPAKREERRFERDARDLDEPPSFSIRFTTARVMERGGDETKEKVR